MNEMWKDTYIYSQQYQVSNYGRVRNKFSRHILTPQTDNKGYLRVRLSWHDEKDTANENQIHAFKTGLNYVTGKAGRKKLHVSKIDIRTGMVSETYSSIAKAAQKNNVYETNIRKVTLGKRKSTGGFGWREESEVMPYAETVNY